MNDKGQETHRPMPVAAWDGSFIFYSILIEHF